MAGRGAKVNISRSLFLEVRFSVFFPRQHSSSTQSMLWHWFWQPFKVVTVKLHLGPNQPLVVQLWTRPDSQKHHFSIALIFLRAPINATPVVSRAFPAAKTGNGNGADGVYNNICRYHRDKMKVHVGGERKLNKTMKDFVMLTLISEIKHVQ